MTREERIDEALRVLGRCPVHWNDPCPGPPKCSNIGSIRRDALNVVRRALGRKPLRRR